MWIRFKTRALSLLELAITAIYLIFEELIWKRFAYHIYRFFKRLRPIRQFNIHIGRRMNRWLVLGLFTFSFVLVEVFGVVSVILIADGHIKTAIAAYLLKIPGSAFAFGILASGKRKLNSFTVFRFAYGNIMRLVEWIKQRDVYHDIKRKLGRLRQRFKTWFARFRLRVKTKHGLLHRLKRRYKFIRRKIIGNCPQEGPWRR